MMSVYSRSLPLLSFHFLYITEASTLAGEKVLGSLRREMTLRRMVLGAWGHGVSSGVTGSAVGAAGSAVGPTLPWEPQAECGPRLPLAGERPESRLSGLSGLKVTGAASRHTLKPAPTQRPPGASNPKVTFSPQARPACQPPSPIHGACRQGGPSAPGHLSLWPGLHRGQAGEDGGWAGVGPQRAARSGAGLSVG